MQGTIGAVTSFRAVILSYLKDIISLLSFLTFLEIDPDINVDINFLSVVEHSSVTDSLHCDQL